MSNLKDTETDDLFRRASDKYPLRTDSSDWDRMAAALEKDPPPPGDGEDTSDRRKKRRFFWLFFLLPLGVGGLGYFAWRSGFASHAGFASHSGAGTKVGSTAAVNPTDKNPTAASGTSTPPAPVVSACGTATAPSTEVANLRDRALLANGRHLTNADGKGNVNRKANAGHAANAGHVSNASHLAEGDDAFDAANANAPAGSNTSAGGSPFSTSLTQNRQDRLFYDLQREPVDRNYQLNVTVTAPAAKKDSTISKQKTSPKRKNSYLYLGLLAAPDLSTVKMQAVKGVGNTFGALVGYAFNSHWAIETGAYLDRKKYYTEGQYFSTKEISWPTTDTLKNVNGTCYMWEIPLNIRYTFNPDAKTRWFATAGFTTYLMTSEKYTYLLDWSGWTTTTTSNVKKPSQYPFSIVNLSAGFEQSLGKVGNLRIEPYLRIPLTGMGTGKLPIMSTGINIGITRQLWKK